jgi:diguanylate cyclase (GGDEF)-like protein
LVAEDTLVGVVSLYAAHPDAFGEDHQRIVEVVTRQVAPVVLRSFEHETTSHRVLRDPLTGLPNLEQLRRITDPSAGASELHATTALIYVDINQLKAINTLHGRGTGDTVLRQVVTCLRANLRSADVLFRLNSDDFAVLLLHTDRATAESVADRMRQALANVTVVPGKRIGVTVIVATCPEDAPQVDMLLDVARRALPMHRRGNVSAAEDYPGSIH